MKNALRLLSAMSFCALLPGPVSAFEQNCRSNSCVSIKNAEFKAVVAAVVFSEDCVTDVSWPYSMRKINDTQWEVVCGDAELLRRTLIYNVENPKGSVRVSDIRVRLSSNYEEIGGMKRLITVSK